MAEESDAGGSSTPEGDDSSGGDDEPAPAADSTGTASGDVDPDDSPGDVDPDAPPGDVDPDDSTGDVETDASIDDAGSDASTDDAASGVESEGEPEAESAVLDETTGADDASGAGDAEDAGSSEDAEPSGDAESSEDADPSGDADDSSNGDDADPARSAAELAEGEWMRSHATEAEALDAETADGEPVDEESIPPPDAVDPAPAPAGDAAAESDPDEPPGELEGEAGEALEGEAGELDPELAPPAAGASTAGGGAGADAEHGSGLGPEPVDVEQYREDYDIAGEVPEGPPDDQEMPLTEHIEEMILRLAIVSAVAAAVAAGVFFVEPVAEDAIMFIWNSVLPDEAAAQPRVYGPLELKLTELKFASLVGFVLALPVFVYQTYRFMRPGLYPHERRYYLAAVPTSLVLAFVGVSFSYYIVLPGLFLYFFRYSERAGTLAFALRQTFDIILVLMGYMALVFQIPLFIMLAIMMGLVDRAWLEDMRLYFWGGFLGLSFLFIPEPTGMAPIVVAVTMVVLFEGTLALLRWTGN